MEKSCICRIFENAQYFNAAIFEKRLNRVLKLLFPEGESAGGAHDWDGTPLTAGQLWDKYYSNESDIWKQYLKSLQKAPIAESEEKKYGISENPTSTIFSKPKEPQIEEIAESPSTGSIIGAARGLRRAKGTKGTNGSKR